jgi:hypothetical protein
LKDLFTDLISTATQPSVHPTGGSLRVFKHFELLEVGSVKVALSRPTHQPVTQAIGQAFAKRAIKSTIKPIGVFKWIT